MLETPQGRITAVTGPEHYQLSEQLLEHAASMLSTDVAPEDRDELVQRQAADRRPRPGQGAGFRSGRPQGRLCPPCRRSRRLGAGGPAMTGPGHFREAERLLEHEASMLDIEVAPEDRAELVQRQAAVASMATAHAVLAAAAAIGLSAHLDRADERAWREVAASPT
jgi:hypothetical protein